MSSDRKRRDDLLKKREREEGRAEYGGGVAAEVTRSPKRDAVPWLDDPGSYAIPAFIDFRADDTIIMRHFCTVAAFKRNYYSI
jgi:hypothetical protein